MSFLFRKKTNSCQQVESPDEEVDGFVLIGQTNDEKNTVKPNDAVNHETPPSYLAVKQENAARVTQSTHQRTAAPVTTENQQNSNCSHNCPRESRSAIKDIPFQFASSIETSLRHEALMEEFPMPELWCDTNMEYSFETEHLVLKY